MKKKKWLLSEVQPAQADQLAQALSLSAIASRVLVARGLDTVEAATAFLDRSPQGIHDPFLLRDMDKAVAEIENAIAQGVKIAVYGDYDVDGVTATCILIQYLEKRGADCIYYIPDRLGEGYGLNTAAIQSLYDQGCRLMITVDSGITATEETDFANLLGMRMIITDHHECKDVLPAAVAVVNPRREDSDYPFRELAGVGVAFKLICALESGRSIIPLLDEYADIVAVGTIADVMPLVGENRMIVSWGLARLKATRNPGLRALMHKLGLDSKELTSNSVSFIMAPRINAAGRLGGAAVAAQMFLTRNPGEAAQLADHLCELNRQRQEEENTIFQEITARLSEDPQLTQGKVLMLWGDGWHNGVIGIVASRLSDRYGMPCILISLSGDHGKGSGRSIKGFNLYAALDKNAALMEKHGGHELAVGLSLHRDQLEPLRQALEAYAQDAAVSQEIVPCVQVDCAVEPDELTPKEIQSFSVLEPFGMGNPQPALMMHDVYVEEITPISHDRHVKLHLSRGGRRFYAFAFGMGAKNCPFEAGDLVDLVFSAEINSYKGRQSVQLIIRDIRWAVREDEADAAVLAVYEAFMAGRPVTGEEARLLSPTKDELRAVFRYIRTNAEADTMTASSRAIYRKIRYNSRGSINLGRFLICLDVFKEFHIFDYTRVGEDLSIRLLPYQGKADINGSVILRRLLDLIKESCHV